MTDPLTDPEVIRRSGRPVRPPGHLPGLWLWPLLVSVASAIALAGLVDGVQERGDLSAVDPSVTASLLTVRSHWLTQVAHGVTTLGSAPVIVALGLALSGALSWRLRSTEPLATMAVALGGSAMLTYGLKVAVARQRPPIADMLGAADHDFAFPSGHTLNSAVFLAVSCWLLRDQLLRQGRARRTVAVTLVLLAALAVGTSRVYLGYHWMTDVLAGWVVALGWLSLLYGGRQWFRRRRAA